ncbi:MAG: restriction endonuclease subunit S [Thermoplasmata archaeon]|nr:restriction endonuclease subunit S [Thermoplasmata archaeon]
MTDFNSLIKKILDSTDVQYKTLGELAIEPMFKGAGITRKELSDSGIPCVRYADIYTTYGVWFDKPATFMSIESASSSKYAYKGDILFAITGEKVEDIAKSTAYVGEEQIAVGGDIVVLRHDQDPKYLSYVLSTTMAQKQKSFGKVKSKVVHSCIPDISKIVVPIPSKDVQHAIVEVLDALSSYSGQLSLQLDVRNIQLRYMRDTMLGVASDDSGKTHFLCHHSSMLDKTDVTYVKVSELFNLRNGYTPSKSEPSFWTDGNIPWFVMDDIRQSGSVLADSSQHITDVAVKGDLFKANSIILSTSATIGYHALITVPFLCNQRFTCMTVKDAYKDKVNVKFLYHYMYVIDEWCKANTFQSSFQAVDMDSFKELLIPLPSKEVQDTIADLFDSATALIDNLANEMSARDIQYQYYRDLILSFGGVES